MLSSLSRRKKKEKGIYVLHLKDDELIFLSVIIGGKKRWYYSGIITEERTGTSLFYTTFASYGLLEWREAAQITSKPRLLLALSKVPSFTTTKDETKEAVQALKHTSKHLSSVISLFYVYHWRRAGQWARPKLYRLFKARSHDHHTKTLIICLLWSSSSTCSLF